MANEKLKYILEEIARERIAREAKREKEMTVDFSITKIYPDHTVRIDWKREKGEA
jgi:hypothetical protein